ncbi:hypothetical protein [Haladaptatus pallidirubidus]|uniref:Uncharacterized protein n=1 Tax=Haladaptatus pallidirubidus TaxID=1008152 RepID=A0AAV3UBA4_9EURY|nr:hypothetical protein [Haladaptatus pallidirubidus]
MVDQWTIQISIKLAGLLVGTLLLGFGVAIWRLPRYEDTDDEYARYFGHVGFILLLVANGGVVWTPFWALALEAGGYALAALFGTRWFLRVTRADDPSPL